MSVDSFKSSIEGNPSKPDELTSDDKTRIVEMHNDLRQKYGVGPLVWDDSLAAMAKKWADVCYWGHWRDEQKTKAKLGSDWFAPAKLAGENLTVWNGATPGKTPGEHGVQAWIDEEPFFNCATGECDGGVCGHYTQMIWNDTGKVGCALRTCSSLDPRSWDTQLLGKNNVKYLVCQYDPPGNYLGERAVNDEACETFQNGGSNSPGNSSNTTPNAPANANAPPNGGTPTTPSTPSGNNTPQSGANAVNTNGAPVEAPGPMNGSEGGREIAEHYYESVAPKDVVMLNANGNPVSGEQSVPSGPGRLTDMLSTQLRRPCKVNRISVMQWCSERNWSVVLFVATLIIALLILISVIVAKLVRKSHEKRWRQRTAVDLMELINQP